MEQKELTALLNRVADGSMPVKDAVLQLRGAPFADLGFAKPDFHRAVRTGAAEVIYGAGKTPEQIVKIAETLLEHGQQTVLITRLQEESAAAVSKELPLTYDPLSRFGYVGALPDPDGDGTVLVASGGTSDLPVAEEAALTAQALGCRVIRRYDVGVAGLERLLAYRDEIMSASCIVVVAGMEGALCSVIGGLASCPVVAVPTSVGYGASFGGLSALLAMLNSCASGVAVMNIDNGFGGGYFASLVDHRGKNG